MVNVKEWTSLSMPELLTMASCRKDWNRMSAESSIMFPRGFNQIKLPAVACDLIVAALVIIVVIIPDPIAVVFLLVINIIAVVAFVLLITIVSMFTLM